MATTAKTFDVLIVGTGPAGSAVALALQKIGVPRIGLLGRVTRPGWRIGEAAPPDVNYRLLALGVTNKLKQLGHLPYHGNVSAWGGSVQVHDFLRSGMGNGWHLDRAAFDQWLLRTAVERGAVLIGAKKIETVNRNGDRWVVTLSADRGPRELKAPILVIATGRAAATALRLQARIHRLDHLVAVAATYPCDPEAFMPGHSLVEAVEIGWWYSAPLPGGRRMAMLMTDNDLVREHALLNKDRFLALMSGTRLLHAVMPQSQGAVGALKTFPAATQYRDRAAGPGWFAAGDALMAFDPLTSAGISGALRDATDVAGRIAKIIGGATFDEAKDLALAYAGRATEMLKRFLNQRRTIYGQETRWPDDPFWRCRIGDISDTGSIGSDRQAP